MKKLIYLLAYQFIFGSCALFKKTDSSSAKSSGVVDSTVVYSDKSKNYVTTNTDSFLQKNDSLSSEYSIKFWPRGQLSFSPSGVLNGEMDSILVKGKGFYKNVSSELTHINVKNSLDVNKKLISVKNTITKDEKKQKTSSFSWKWIIFFALGIGTAVFLWLKLRSK